MPFELGQAPQALRLAAIFMATAVSSVAQNGDTQPEPIADTPTGSSSDGTWGDPNVEWWGPYNYAVRCIHVRNIWATVD